MTQSADLKIAGKALSSYFPSTSVSNPEALRESTREAFQVRADAGVDGDVGRIDSSGLRLMVHGKGTLRFFFLLGCDVPIVLRVVGEDRHYEVSRNLLSA